MRAFIGLIAVTCVLAVQDVTPRVWREVEAALGRVVLRMRAVPDAKLPSGAVALRDLIRQPEDRAMSELSPPVALTRTLLPAGADRITACVEVVRIGGSHRVWLADYAVKIVKKANVWEMDDVDAGAECPARPVSGRPHAILRDASQDPRK